MVYKRLFYTFSLPSGKRPLFSIAKGSYECKRGSPLRILNAKRCNISNANFYITLLNNEELIKENLALRNV